MTQTAPQPGSKAAPGWYPDPATPGTLRYWSGDKWLDWRAPMQQPPRHTPARVTAPIPWILPVLAAVVAVTLLSIWFGMAPDTAYEEMRSGIESTDDQNNAMTDGAPQQAVVNGWTANEYLHLLSVQQQESDDRRDVMLLIGLLGAAAGMGLYGATTRRSADTR
ncbi:DUF2510 domain-containing protein [Nocardioides nanhaiensis]|uniref:DUF2510 domain-containing protein n=1 Tax=Nocardioides nanhaiensis TaxID=1476871 RepID=A0ABP8VPL2_9ACTN